MPTLRLTVEYEGTRYHGWQEQQNARTVAGELRRAIEATGAPIVDLAGSGRTDAGVHALAQTAHLRLRRTVEPESFRRAVNEGLPAEIHLLSVRPAPEGFHARHDAVSRSYLYQICRRRTALAKRHVWWVKRPLVVERMVEASSILRGRHDFVSFCERPSEQPSTLVVVESVEVATSGALVLIRLVASHFLWKMVRRVVGAVVRVGAGEMSSGDLSGLLAGAVGAPRSPGIAQWTAPPSGLFLERVLYPGDPPLPPIAPAVPVASEEAEPSSPSKGPLPKRRH